MRCTMTATVAAAALVFVAMSVWPDGSGRLADPTAQAQQLQSPEQDKRALPAKTEKADPDSQTLARLDKTISAEFPVETPLQACLDYLANAVEVQVYVDQRALDDVGVQPDAPITINLKEVPAEMALRLMLRRLDLAYMLDHGVVIVTNTAEAENNLDARVYRIADLVRMPVASQQVDPFSGPPGASSAQVYMRSRGDHPGAVSFDDLQAIIGLITSTIEPTTWDDAGGPGSIAPYRGTLVIAQTMRVHRKVEKLLNDLREAIDPDFPVRPTSQSTSGNTT